MAVLGCKRYAEKSMYANELRKKWFKKATTFANKDDSIIYGTPLYHAKKQNYPYIRIIILIIRYLQEFIRILSVSYPCQNLIFQAENARKYGSLCG